MTIYAAVDAALSGLNLPYYAGMPEFAPEEEPEVYLTYNAYDNPVCFADNEEHGYEYTVTVNVITPVSDAVTRRKVRNAMKAAGFTYQSGTDATQDDITYPRRVQYALDFKIVLEE